MWVLAEWMHRRKPTTLGAASGAVAGLATVTPAAGFVGPNAAVFIGLLAGLACYWAVALKPRIGYDDSLDVVGIHGLSGVVGTLCLGMFASKMVNPAGADGLFAGNSKFFMIQLTGVVAVLVYAFVVTFVLAKAIDVMMGLRVSEASEVDGLDISEHSETAYSH